MTQEPAYNDEQRLKRLLHWAQTQNHVDRDDILTGVVFACEQALYWRSCALDNLRELRKVSDHTTKFLDDAIKEAVQLQEGKTE